MKLPYIVILIFCLGINPVSAQTDVAKPATEKLSSGPEYDKYYNKLKELHLKKETSESQKKHRKLFREFYNKINKEYRTNVPYPSPLYWIMDNIEKTTFGSYENAEMEWNIVTAANTANVDSNKEYYEYVKECFDKCDAKILSDVMREVMEEHPEIIFE